MSLPLSLVPIVLFKISVSPYYVVSSVLETEETAGRTSDPLFPSRS